MVDGGLKYKIRTASLLSGFYLPGLAPSDQQVIFFGLCSSSDSVEPGRS